MITLHSEYTADEIEEQAAQDRADGLTPSTTVFHVRWQVFEQITGCDDVIIHSADGCTFLGEIQDWVEERSNITVELS